MCTWTPAVCRSHWGPRSDPNLSSSGRFYESRQTSSKRGRWKTTQVLNYYACKVLIETYQTSEKVHYLHAIRTVLCARNCCPPTRMVTSVRMLRLRRRLKLNSTSPACRVNVMQPSAALDMLTTCIETVQHLVKHVGRDIQVPTSSPNQIIKSFFFYKSFILLHYKS